MSGGWIGVDLDGTLAYYDGWIGDWHVGDPNTGMPWVNPALIEQEEPTP